MLLQEPIVKCPKIWGAAILSYFKSTAARIFTSQKPSNTNIQSAFSSGGPDSQHTTTR
jgi:hypothetical protein